jgi:ribosome modulation factor
MTDTGRPPSKIFEDGMDARRRGLAVTACPYPQGSDECQAWTEGWHEGDALDQDSAPDDERFMPRET